MANPNTPSLKPSIRPLVSARLLLEAVHRASRQERVRATGPARLDEGLPAPLIA